MLEHRVEDLEQVFNACFQTTWQTRLVSGALEPIYRPAEHGQELAEIHSTRDYFSSALHEIAHWCIAGPERLKLEDYGYWYEPDGRNEATQRLFEKVEYKPQALEWVFTKACQARFRLSVDNVGQPELKPSESFIEAVTQQARIYAASGLPERARIFVEALKAHYRTDEPLLSVDNFEDAELR